jgi:homoserine dehydrogenase
MSSQPPLRVAVLGAGTVGGSVVRAFLERPERLAPHGAPRLVLAAVAERDFARARALGIPDGLLTDAPAHLVADPAIDVIVELMGGAEPAHTLIAAALGAGKSVVTANKHVVAHHGPELEALARRSGAAFRFEAAVGGGIPVLSPLASDLAVNEVHRVRGIVNGTTNYILTALGESGSSYDDVLADAQAAGYAEADPRGDVEGDDAVNKVVILARLAFGRWVDPGTVRTAPPTVAGTGRPGITGVSSAEQQGACALGLRLKLLAAAEACPGGGLEMSVLPTAIPDGSALGVTGGVLNRVEVLAAPVGEVGFSGPGAGGDATSSAVLGDLLALAQGHGSTWGTLPPPPAMTAGASTVDPLGASRAWFAFVPGVPAAHVAGIPAAGVAVARVVADGVAVRTEPLTLDQARRAVASLAPGGPDVPLYPVADA